MHVSWSAPNPLGLGKAISKFTSTVQIQTYYQQRVYLSTKIARPQDLGIWAINELVKIFENTYFISVQIDAVCRVHADL